MRPVLALAVLAAVALPVAACGGTGVEDVEQQVADELSAQLARQRAREDELRRRGVLDDHGGAPAGAEHGDETGTPQVDSVDCPDDADTERGSVFRCKALGPGDREVGTVTVQMGDDGKATWEFLAGSAGLAG